MVTIRQWLIENKDKYQDDRINGIKACAKDLNVSIKAIQNKAVGWNAQGMHYSPVSSSGLIPYGSISKKVNKKDIMQPEDFLAGIDIVKHIMDFLNDELKDGYIEDEKLRRRFEISITRWNEIKRLPIWEGRVFPYTRRDGTKATVWSSIKGIKKARATISMTRYEL